MIPAPGTLSVTVLTDGRSGLSPEQVAELCVDRLLRVPEQAEADETDPARVRRLRLLDVVFQHIRLAIAEDRRAVGRD
jgi:hypothetical protein